MLALTLRQARREDAAVIAGFNIALAQETEALALDPDTVLKGVTRLLNTPDLGFYTVAEADGQVVGCLMITYEWSDWRNGVIWWLQSVYVDQAFRRQGVFRAMYGHVQQQAQSKPDVAGFRLYVEHNNQAAQRTYSDQGMAKTHYLMFEDLKSSC
jgi:ribosomal protein S18 acetylase RimI-like enzyme